MANDPVERFLEGCVDAIGAGLHTAVDPFVEDNKPTTDERIATALEKLAEDK